MMSLRVLIFDIGGTVFDWNTAIVDTLHRLMPGDRMSDQDRRDFAFSCRSEFLALKAAVVRKEVPWMTADQVLAAAIDRSCDRAGLFDLSAADRIDLSHSWRRMQA